jgi:hypothetical protein
MRCAGCTRSNAVQLSGEPVEDENLRGGVVFDDLVVSVFHVGVADGDSPDHSWAGPESALGQLLFVDVDDRFADRGVKCGGGKSPPGSVPGGG